jgi:hypothetical protein
MPARLFVIVCFWSNDPLRPQRSLKFTGIALRGVNFVAISLFHAPLPKAHGDVSRAGRRCFARLNAIRRELRAN